MGCIFLIIILPIWMLYFFLSDTHLIRLYGFEKSFGIDNFCANLILVV